MKCLRIKKFQTWGSSTTLIPIGSIRAVEFHNSPSYIKVYYLDKSIDGYVNVNIFEPHVLFNCIENNESEHFSVYESYEDTPDVPDLEKVEEKNE